MGGASTYGGTVVSHVMFGKKGSGVPGMHTLSPKGLHKAEPGVLDLLVGDDDDDVENDS